MVGRGESKVLGKKRKCSEKKQACNTELLPMLPKDVARKIVAKGKTKVLGKKRKKFEEEWGCNTELLPNLPNELTVHLICTKLPWRTFHVLSSVSRAWLGAIRSGEINDIRVRSRTAETLALFECFTDRYESQWAIALYSLRDKAVYRLPSLPGYEGIDIAIDTGWIAIGGKVYFLGIVVGTEVWVLDVAGQKKWQKCASMQTLRTDFGCAVFEGKIYVFGGCTRRRQPFNFSEVYDPKVDSWTKISPMKSARIRCKTCAFRDEILVYSGCVYDRDYTSGYSEKYWRLTEGSRDGMEVYNPAKDSWRTILSGDIGNHELQVPGDSKPEEVLFTADGRLHCFSQSKIESIDLDKNSVKGLHTVSFKTRPFRILPFWPDAVLATNDGFLTKGTFDKCRLYQSTELGMGKKRILLKKVKCSPVVRFIEDSFLTPIQL